ncbi:hypothetical protein [Sulfurimonas sp.]|jgi:hypothetical protein|uniref:hypothetical protein n=1 Tax=Sulfurimonas sp. TaxID=2022749 RepID=UPI0025E97FDC|nr:hypothetical protein [Sulfurimonas sp.]
MTSLYNASEVNIQDSNMQSENIKHSGFALAKKKELKGNDFYDVKTIGNLTIAVVCDGVGSVMKVPMLQKEPLTS